MKNEYDILNSFTILEKAIYSSVLYFIVHLSIAMKFNNEYPYYTGCPTIHDSGWCLVQYFFLFFFYTKENILWQSYHSKIDFKLKYVREKDFFNEIKLIFLYLIQFMEEDYLPIVMIRGTPCILESCSELYIKIWLIKQIFIAS